MSINLRFFFSQLLIAFTPVALFFYKLQFDIENASLIILDNIYKELVDMFNIRLIYFCDSLTTRIWPFG